MYRLGQPTDSTSEMETYEFFSRRQTKHLFIKLTRMRVQPSGTHHADERFVAASVVMVTSRRESPAEGAQASEHARLERVAAVWRQRGECEGVRVDSVVDADPVVAMGTQHHRVVAH